MLTAGLIVAAFLLGSIPFGLLIGLAKGVDIRQHGSKNIGATNAGRVLGRKWGFLCFGLDFLKGLIPTLAAGVMLGTLGRLDAPAGLAFQWLAVVVAAVAGHMYSPWIGFKGGKGVATGFGALLGVWPALGLPALGALVLWAVVLKSTRYMGLASCLAAASLPVSAAFAVRLAQVLGLVGGPSHPSDQGGGAGDWALWPYVAVSAFLALVVIVKHRGNIARMLSGTELRIGGGKAGG